MNGPGGSGRPPVECKVMRSLLALVPALFAGGCFLASPSSAPLDAGATDASIVLRVDAGRPDGGPEADAGPPGDDAGCAARGDECEQTGYGQCDGVCLDIRVDANNCGQCGRVCEVGVECIDGFCGGLFAFEGIRENTPDDLLGGWEVCHNDRYNQSEATFANIRAACNGEFVMLGCRPVGQANWTLLAMGDRDEVFEDTVQGNVLNPHNGVDWYFSDSYSMGFVEPGTGVSRNSCDTANVRPERRMCWHTGQGRMNSGYRCGATFLNGNANWERTIWTSR